MKNDNKKLAMYIGVALLVGAVGYVAYYKMSSKKLGGVVATDETDTTASTTTSTTNWNAPKSFSSNPANQLTVGQIGIKTPSIATDLLNSFK